MPKSFRVGEERAHISRPGQSLATHTQPLAGDSQVVRDLGRLELASGYSVQTSVHHS